MCKLLNPMMLPILSYPKGGEVNPKGLMYGHFLRQLLGVRKSTTNQKSLAGYPVQTHNQVLLYHN